MSAAESPEPGRELSLEAALARLDEISQRLESAELELAESLELYEEGVRLLRACDGLIGGAEQRIQRLRAEGDGFRVDPLPGSE